MIIYALYRDALRIADNLLREVESTVLKVALVASGTQLGIWLVKWGITSQVCSEVRICSFNTTEALRVCREKELQAALVDRAHPSFRWEIDSKEERALVDLANPPLDLKNRTFEECLISAACKPIPQTDFCRKIYSKMHFVEGIVNTISEKARLILTSVLLWTFNRIVHRGP